MNSRMLFALVLVGVLGLTYADQHEGQPGSVCALEETAKRALLGCVQANLHADTNQKLQNMKGQFDCADVYCVFLAICHRNNGTLELPPSSTLFTEAEKADLRSTILTCRDNLLNQASRTT
ncbi:uncharacterized protein LOC119451558 [Dermacentor silvarum]|uniref:uncharacterized protein LOC119451558 n=1 Tax=Dermacentor silvarum TaxID=543639 RepID=UPI00189A6631|nr:uncharacterized protein LOC119451558 [Dermacentor silvarum]